MKVTRYKVCQLHKVRLDRISRLVARNMKQERLKFLHHEFHNSIRMHFMSACS